MCEARTVKRPTLSFCGKEEQGSGCSFVAIGQNGTKRTLRRRMKRHESRKNAFLLVFQQPINNASTEEMLENIDSGEIQTDEFCLNLLGCTMNNLSEIDDAIKPHLKKWTLERLPKVSLAVLRISCAQMLFMPDVPASVIINEAVELAKLYGDAEAPKFINGVLGAISRGD